MQNVHKLFEKKFVVCKQYRKHSKVPAKHSCKIKIKNKF